MAIRMRWDPIAEIASLQRDLNRALGAFREGDAGTSAWMPPVDVWETERELVYAFDLPGMPEDRISIELEDNALTVSGERERSTEIPRDTFYRFERRFGQFSRTIGVPQGISESDISADYRDGVLQVRIAKPEAPKPKKIQIGSAERGGTIEGQATPQAPEGQTAQA